LPPSFGQLHRLRYLNLKGNRLRSIPLALTSLPSLEILDLSKNALDHLPPDPGSLVSLRVLSLSHNSLRTLPGYLADFLELKVCKLEHNPLVWPPAWVLGRIGDDGREMDEREWIRNVRDFLRREPEPPAYSLRAEDDGSRADEDDGEAGGESGSSSGDEEGPDRLRRLQRLQQQRPTKHAYDAAPSTSIALTSSTMTDEDRRRLRRAGAVGPTYAVHSRDNSELSDLRGPLGSPLADEGGLGGNSSSHSGGTTEAAGGDPFRPQQQQPYAVPPAYDTTVSSSTASAPATVHDRARSPTTAIAPQLPPPRSTQSPSSVVAGDGDGTRAGAHVELGPVVVDQAASGGEVQTPPSSTNTGVKTSGPNEGFQEALSPPPPSQPSLQQTTPHAQFSTFSLSAPSPTKRSFPPSSTVTQVPVAALPQSRAITAEGGASRTSPSIEPVDDRKAGLAQAGHSAPNPASAGPTSNLYGVSPRQNSTDVLSSARGSFARSSISSAGGGGGGHARHHSHHQTSTLIDGGGPGGVGGGGGGGLIGNPHHRQQYEQQHALQQAQLHAGVGVPRLGSKASAGSIHRLAFPLNGGAGGGPAFSRTAAAAAISGGSPNVAPAAGGRSGGVAGGPGAGADSATAPTAGGQLIEGSRDSYFRRLSTLPPSTIPASMPPALLTLIDGARGLLFALAQIQATLRRHPTSPLDDRFAGVLSRVLAPAAGATDSLINALDRFDSTSRRASSPPARVVRGVVEAVKANVGAYGKVIAVLIIQLKVSFSKLATNASGRPSTPSGNGAGHPFQQQRENFEDIRFTRTLLLNLYGAMGEVSHAWQTMIPVLPAVAPLLRDPNAPPRQPLAAAPQQPTNGSGPAAAGVSPQPHPGGRQTRLLSSASARGGHPMSPVPERLEGSGASASTMTPGTLDGLSPGTLPPPSRHKRGASSGEGGAAGSEGSGRDPTAVAGSTSAAPDQTETNGSGGHHRPSHSRTHSQKIQREAQQHREAQALARQQQQQQAEADSRRQGGAQTSSAAPTGGDAGPPASPEAPDLAGQLLEEAVQTGFAVWNLMENDLQWHGVRRGLLLAIFRRQTADRGLLLLLAAELGRLQPLALATLHRPRLGNRLQADRRPPGRHRLGQSPHAPAARDDACRGQQRRLIGGGRADACRACDRILPERSQGRRHDACRLRERAPRVQARFEGRARQAHKADDGEVRTRAARVRGLR